MRFWVLLALGALASCTTFPHAFDLNRFQSDRPEFGLTRGPDGWYLSRMDGAFGRDTSSMIWRFPFDGGPASPATFSTNGAIDRDFAWDPERGLAAFVRDGDIYWLYWRGDRWDEAEVIPFPVSTEGYEASPHFAPDGSMYFSSAREGGAGQGDIYRGRWGMSGWSVEPLGPQVNSPTGEWNLTLSPDGSMMVFEASGRPTNRTVSGDLYLSCKIGDEWQPAEPMDALNTDGSDLDFRFTGPCEGVFTSATIGGDGVLRHAGPENFARCG